jgi:hypothetical protein
MRCRICYNFTVAGYTFRADGRYFVLAERHKSRDTLGLYDAAESYKLARVSLWPLFQTLIK